MQKKMQKHVSLVTCLIMIAVLLISQFSISSVFAVTNNVSQSRRVAEVADFPLSYQEGLTKIKEAYPNSTLIYYDTDLDWYADVLTSENELKRGRNLVPSNSPSSWKSQDYAYFSPFTNKYIDIEPGWNQASVALVEYYMDPRNFFNPTDIFQFLDLSWHESETVESIQRMLDGSFMDNVTIFDNNGKEVTYAEALCKIGKYTGVSSSLLACRILQEQGDGTSALISGNYVSNPGYYNYFNIGAYGDTTQKIVINGLIYAKNNDWSTPYKSIYGGAKHLNDNYISTNKNNLYLQHFNTVAQNGIVDYSVYMANTLAPYNEGRLMASSFVDDNANYVFIIPVYDNMPESPCNLPSESGTMLTEISLNNGELSIENFDPSQHFYEISTDASISHLTIKAIAHADAALVEINGSEVSFDKHHGIEKAVVLEPGINDIAIKVTATNGAYRTYTLGIINDDGAPHYTASTLDLTSDDLVLQPGFSVKKLREEIRTVNCSVLVANPNGKIKSNRDVCASGDILMIKNDQKQIVFNSRIAIYGDVDSDGYVTSKDIDIAKSHMLEICTLNSFEKSIVDIDQDGEITVIDLGKMRVLTDDDFVPYNSNVAVSVNAPDDMYKGKSINAAVSASEGTYYAEGYLLYNEGRITTQDEENSGQIHFVADGSSVTFDNSKNHVSFSSLLRAGTIDFDVNVVHAYDYTVSKEIDVSTESKTSYIKNSELEVSVELNESAAEGTVDYNSVTLTIKNISSKSIGNVSISLGDYLENNDGEKDVKIVGLQPMRHKTFKLYTMDNLTSGTYDTSITIKYQDANCIISLMQIPVSFAVLAHEHSVEWKVADTEHYVDCDECAYELKEAHTYFEESENIYKCTVCGYKKEFQLTIEPISSSEMTPVTLKAVLTKDGEVVNTSFYKTAWYVNGVRVSNSNPLPGQFKSVGNRTVDCVVTTSEGLVIIESSNVDVSKVTYSDRAMTVAKTTCNSIEMKSYEGYEYKLGEGEWQDSPVFEGLVAGQEYTIFQREKAYPYVVAHLQVMVGHRGDAIEITKKCNGNASREFNCIYCNQVIALDFEETSRDHVFIYDVTTEASCRTPTIKTADCAYGCGVRDIKMLNDQKKHEFTRYVFDHNKTCVSGGTCTASCNYGCGTTDTIWMNIATAGHEYVYVPDNNATANSSMTETGTCEYCGQTNIRTVDGTRLEGMDAIYVEIATASTERCELPKITCLTDGIIISNVIWANESGMEFSGSALGISIREGEIYELKTLELEVSDEYTVSVDNLKLYINDTLFAGKAKIESEKIVFTDIGQIKF